MFFMTISIFSCKNNEPINNDEVSKIEISSALVAYSTSQYGSIGDYSNKIDSIPVQGRICFRINEDLSVKSFNWSFPGGTPSSSTDINPQITYNTNGKYPITVKVTTNSGKIITKTVDNYVVVGSSGYNGTWTKLYEIKDNVNVGNQGYYQVNAAFTRFQFVDNKIYAISFASGIFCSSDGGINWTNIVGNLPQGSTQWSGCAYSYAINEIFFDSNILYLCCNDGIYKSTNNGTNWVKIYDSYSFNIVDGHSPMSIVKSGNNLIALLHNSQESKLIISQDNGLTWKVVLYPLDVSRINFIGSINSSMLVAIDGNYQKRYVSTDNGLTWSSTNIDYKLESITLLGNNLYAIDESSIKADWSSAKLMYSSDYGKTWQPTGGVINSFRPTKDISSYPKLFISDNSLLYKCELSLNNGKSFIDISDSLSNEYNDSGYKYCTFTCSGIYNDMIFASTGFAIYKRPLSDF